MKSKFRFLSLLSRLGKDKHASGPRLLARLLRDEEGSYLLIVTLAMPVFIGLAGLATEGALIFYNHRTVQSAADSAAYSAAIAYSIDSTADITTQAQAIVASYGFVVDTGNANATDKATVVATVDTTTYSSPAIDVAVTRPQLPILSGIWINNPFNVGGHAKAIIHGGAGGGSGNCILSLAPTGTGIGGTSSISDSDGTCGIFSNSTSSLSISLSGNASITAGSVGAAGTVSVGGNIGPPPNGYTQGDNPVINPYAGVTTPAPGTACTNTDTVIKNTIVTLNPGTYCTSNPNINGAIDVQNSNVTLSAGTYTLNGSFNIKGSIVTLGAGTYIFVGPAQLFVGPAQPSVDCNPQSTLTGKGVTLVFTDPSNATYPNGQACGNSPNSPVAMDIISGANIDLEAPTSGATQGMLIIANSNIPTDTVFNLWANGALSTGISGVIYVPTGDFAWGGGPIQRGGCTQMIAYKLTLQGNATFSNANCNLSGGGGGGVKPIGNVVTLVR
jgi:Flp pilus assembly protein TadG